MDNWISVYDAFPIRHILDNGKPGFSDDVLVVQDWRLQGGGVRIRIDKLAPDDWCKYEPPWSTTYEVRYWQPLPALP